MPDSPGLLPVLLAQVDELRASGDIENACQVLFLCAALSKHLDEDADALQLLEQINRLASLNNWSQVVQWSTWGSAAVKFHQGEIQGAAERLDGLQNLLIQAGDWVLADLVEILSVTLLEKLPNSFQNDSIISSLIGWGETPLLLETPCLDSKNGSSVHTKGFERVSMWLSTLVGMFHLLQRRKSLQTVDLGLIELASRPGSAPVHQDIPARVSLESAGINDNNEPTLVVYCLGQFQAYQDEQLIEDWPTHKSKLVFKYMITHRERPIAKEVLMDIFWQDSSPGAARNNLNVAIHGIRKVLHHKNPDFSHILFQDGQYSFNPNIRIWVDAEEFSSQIKYARELNTRADSATILQENQRAETLYQGDFLEEDRYEEWTIMIRESLRLAYLDCLSQLSHIYFLQDQYLAAAALCRRILTYDDCSEDAYRLLMRCYARQGQPNLALRLYHSCLATLKEELDVPPSSETQALYDRIRRYKPV